MPESQEMPEVHSTSSGERLNAPDTDKMEEDAVPDTESVPDTEEGMSTPPISEAERTSPGQSGVLERKKDAPTSPEISYSGTAPTVVHEISGRGSVPVSITVRTQNPDVFVARGAINTALPIDEPMESDQQRKAS